MKQRSSRRIHTITSAAGEYFVAAQIMKIGGVASLAPKNTPGVDVLATSLDGNRFANIQVKTKQHGRDWPLGNKPIVPNEHLFYIFIDLRGPYQEYYIVPSKLLYKLVEIPFLEWKNAPTRSGGVRVSKLRVLREKQLKQLKEYRDNWRILNLW